MRLNGRSCDSVLPASDEATVGAGPAAWPPPDDGEGSGLRTRVAGEGLRSALRLPGLADGEGEGSPRAVADGEWVGVGEPTRTIGELSGWLAEEGDGEES